MGLPIWLQAILGITACLVHVVMSDTMSTKASLLFVPAGCDFSPFCSSATHGAQFQPQTLHPYIIWVSPFWRGGGGGGGMGSLWRPLYSGSGAHLRVGDRPLSTNGACSHIPECTDSVGAALCVSSVRLFRSFVSLVSTSAIHALHNKPASLTLIIDSGMHHMARGE